MIEETLITYGPMGVMLAWFMFRTETVIKNNTKALSSFLEVARTCKPKDL